VFVPRVAPAIIVPVFFKKLRRSIMAVPPIADLGNESVTFLRRWTGVGTLAMGIANFNRNFHFGLPVAPSLHSFVFQRTLPFPVSCPDSRLGNYPSDNNGAQFFCRPGVYGGTGMTGSRNDTHTEGREGFRFVPFSLIIDIGNRKTHRPYKEHVYRPPSRS